MKSIINIGGKRFLVVPLATFSRGKKSLRFIPMPPKLDKTEEKKSEDATPRV